MTSNEIQNQIVPQETIALRAYERYVGRGGQHGHDVEDWLAAEEEVVAELGGSTSATASSSA